MAENPKISQDDFVYFIYSEQQEKMRKEVESKIGRVFNCGTVVVNGMRKPFTEISTKEVTRYPDAKIVASGYKSKIKYTDIRITLKRR